MTRQEKEKIYREIEHEYLLEDAKYFVEYYLESNPETKADNIDYDKIVEQFEWSEDVNIPVADTWTTVIEEYFRELNARA